MVQKFTEPGPECKTFELSEPSIFQREIDDAIINLHSNLANGADEQNQNLPIAERNLVKTEIEVLFKLEQLHEYRKTGQ